MLELLVDGRGAIVAVIGEPGIGKSRLVAEACGRVDGVRVLAGHALSYTETIPYWPVRDLLRNWLGLGISDPEARVRLELKAALASVLPDEADELYPFLAGILGLTLDPDSLERLTQLSSDSVQQQTFDSVLRLCAALAAECPLCLVIEDLHWADDSTLDLVEKLLAVSDDEAIALLLLYRSERDHRAWELGQSARRRLPHRYQELELTPLDAADSRLLATGAAGAELPEALLSLIADRAGGNPFFVEEALADLVERGVVHRRNGRFEFVKGAPELTVPALVQEALQARLDRIDAMAREVVNVASVIGRDFGLELLERVVPSEGLRRALSELQRLELVVELRRRPAPEYRFRHVLVQEVAYRSLLEARRRELHGAVGRALEQLHAGSPAEVYGLLAWHFGQSDRPEEAVDYLLRAGDAARTLFANEEARGFYRQAIALLADDDRRARKTLFKLALSHHLAFEFGPASDAYERAFRLPPTAAGAGEPSAPIEVLWNAIYDPTPGTYMTGDVWIAALLFRGLVTLDAELNVVPDLAEQFTVASDGLTYRFRLRTDATWSDGVPVTAEDFAYTFRRMRDENVASSGLLKPIETAVATDRLTLEIHLRAASSLFLHLLAMPYAFAWPKHSCEALGDGWRDPVNLVGSGPFVLAELGDEQATLRARAEWFGPRGNVREASFSLAPLGSSYAGAWRSGRGDILATNTEIFRDDDDTVVEPGSALGTWYLGFRANGPPFDDHRIRKAFALALDRERTHVAWTGPSQPVGRGGFIPPAIPGHSHRIGLPYDPERARQLLAEAGHPGGRGLPVLTLAIDEGVHEIPTYAKPFVDAWEALGVRVAVEIPSLPQMPEATRRCHLWVWGWYPDFPDPHGLLGSIFAGLPLLDDPQVSELLERAETLQDQHARLDVHREVDRLIVAERVALVPLHYDRTILVRRPWVEGYVPHPLLIAAPLDWLVVDEERQARRS